jgi:hypothetical protein
MSIIMQKKIIVKVPDGKLLKLFLAVENNIIEEIQITGDFFVYPEEAIMQLEQRLCKHIVNKEQLHETIHHFVVEKGIAFFGITEDALVEAIMQVRQ